ncbi:uncharacterized protein LOC105844713 [Hydra vulgaris]|uniref:uncharacterized protein LOC105844713 n=1 Tax=Hydra vulgaris TaxID=6087 RepID=UPI001F5EB68C|nr:uncharacterized protein LOC105844713 [Hydra vulgaris]
MWTLIMEYIVYLLLQLQNKSCLELFSMVNTTEIKKNQLLTTLTNFPTEYELSFDVMLTTYIYKWASIIHLTNGSNMGNYGDRTPALWVSVDNKLYFVSAINGTADSYFYSDITLPINKWIKIKISQRNIINQYIFVIDVANSTVYCTQNTVLTNFNNVRVYMGDPWYDAQPGLIRSFVIVDLLSDRNMHNKPLIKVNIDGQLTNRKSLFLNTSISYASETDPTACNLTLEYMLPYFLKITSQSENYSNKGLIYTIPGAFLTKKIYHFMNITLNMTSCLLCGDFIIEIPIKISFNDCAGYTINQYASFKTSVDSSFNSNPIFKRDKNALKESYGRGICWNQEESWIYACMNLYVTIDKTACYVSNNYGEEWSKLDIRVGSVLGHHLLTRDLYVIHRNQKTYLMYHKTYEKWLAVPSSEFEKSILKNLNFSLCLKFEETYDQILILQTHQWMGNEEGLFFRNTAYGTWTRRIKWKELQ